MIKAEKMVPIRFCVRLPHILPTLCPIKYNSAKSPEAEAEADIHAKRDLRAVQSSDCFRRIEKHPIKSNAPPHKLPQL